MAGVNVPIQPVQTAVASGVAVNNLTIDIAPVAGESVYVYGLDVSFALANSYSVVILHNTASVAWTWQMNQSVEKDFNNAPLKLTQGSSAQAVVSYTASLANNQASAVLRYQQKP